MEAVFVQVGIVWGLMWANVRGGGPSQLMSIKVKCHPLFSRI